MADKGVFKRCGCTETGPDGKRRELGSKCPRLDERGHGTWWYQADVAPLPGTGKKRRRIRRGGFETAKKAETARSKIMGKGEKAAQRRVPNDRVTVAEFLDSWISTRKLKRNTLKSYRGHIDRFLKPYLGHLRLLDLSVTDVAGMFDAIEEINIEIRENRANQPTLRRGQSAPPGYDTRKPLEAASMQRVRATLRAALNSQSAAEVGVTTNAAAKVELPSGKPPRPMLWTAARVTEWQVTGEVPGKVMVWPPALLGSFLDFAADEDPRLAPMFDLIANVGLRRGEACGLRTSDVDLSLKLLRIETQLTVVDWQVIEDSPKSEHSNRPIPLSPPMVTLLREQAQQSAREADKWGSAWVDCGRVFVQEGGEQWHPDTVSARFRQLVADSGLPPITLHGLRHCAATLGLAAGLDIKVVQELLGHSSHKLTADTYTSVLEEMSTAAVEAISNLIPRRVGAKNGTDGTELEPKAERAPEPGALEAANLLVEGVIDGAPSGTRTPNPLIKSERD